MDETGMHFVNCARCGGGYWSLRRIKRGYCSMCRPVVIAERKRAWERRNRERVLDLYEVMGESPRALTVVSDPLEEGGFAAGTRFSVEECEAMLRHFAFTPGTVLRDANGKLYKFQDGDFVKE